MTFTNYFSWKWPRELSLLAPRRVCAGLDIQSVEHLPWYAVGVQLVQISFLRMCKIRSIVPPSGPPLLRMGGKGEWELWLRAIMQTMSLAWNLAKDWGTHHKSQEKLKDICGDPTHLHAFVSYFCYNTASWTGCKETDIYSLTLEARSPKARCG